MSSGQGVNGRWFGSRADLPPAQPPLKLRRVHRSLGEGGKAESREVGRGARIRREAARVGLRWPTRYNAHDGHSAGGLRSRRHADRFAPGPRRRDQRADRRARWRTAQPRGGDRDGGRRGSGSRSDGAEPPPGSTLPHQARSSGSLPTTASGSPCTPGRTTASWRRSRRCAPRVSPWRYSPTSPAGPPARSWSGSSWPVFFAGPWRRQPARTQARSDGITHLAAHADVTPSATVLVGDSPIDVKTARAARAIVPRALRIRAAGGGVALQPGELAVDVPVGAAGRHQIVPARYRRRSASGNLSIAYLSIVLGIRR